MRLKICDSHLRCKVANKCLNVREREEVVDWNKRWSPSFPCFPVSCQCPWKKTLIVKKYTSQCFQVFQGYSTLLSMIKLAKLIHWRKLWFFLFFTISKKHFFRVWLFQEKSIKKQIFLTEWKKSFLQKKKKEYEEKKTIKVHIEIFQENKRERNLKAINCQKLLCAN